MSDEHAHEPSEVTYAEYFHPARPRSLRYRTRVKQLVRAAHGQDRRPAERHQPGVRVVAAEPVDARRRERRSAGSSPARAACGRTRSPTPTRGTRSTSASVWFTAYPISLITRPGESFLAALGDEELWKAFADIGINGRAHRAGQARGRASPGGGPRPASTGTSTASAPQIDPAFGTEDEFRAMCGDGHLVRRHDHRRHRARPHRQGRRLPARRDEATPTTPASTTWSRSSRRTGTCCPTSRRAATRSTSTPRPRSALREGRLHHRPAAAGDLLRRGRQGDQLERDRRRSSASTASSAAGCTCTTSRRASPRSTGSTRRSPGMRLVIGDALHSLADLGTGGAAAGRQRLPRRREERRRAAGLVGGAPAVRGGEPPHRAAWCARSAASPSRSSTSPSTTSATPARPAPTCPTTSSPGPPTSTRWPPATPSSCG